MEMNDALAKRLRNIEVGVILLAGTVSAVVWYRVVIWIWMERAGAGWWDSPESGAHVVSALLALAITWLLWGRVAYWQETADANEPE